MVSARDSYRVQSDNNMDKCRLETNVGQLDVISNPTGEAASASATSSDSTMVIFCCDEFKGQLRGIPGKLIVIYSSNGNHNFTSSSSVLGE